MEAKETIIDGEFRVKRSFNGSVTIRDLEDKSGQTYLILSESQVVKMITALAEMLKR